MKSILFSGLLFPVIISLVGMVMMGCQRSPTLNTSEKIVDVYQPVVDFSSENQMKYAQEYDRAAAGYDKKLQEQNLTAADSLFALSQSVYCRVIIHQTSGLVEGLELTRQLLAREETLPQELRADFYFGLGRFYFMEQSPDSALHFVQLALHNFKQYYPPGHIKVAQALTLLGLIYIDFDHGHSLDSIHYYTREANNYFLRHVEIKDYDWELDYLLGIGSLLERAHERGEYHCRVAIEKVKRLPVEHKWLEAGLWNLLGKMIKKRGDTLSGEDAADTEQRRKRLYEAADSIFLKAILIAKNSQDDRLMVFHEARIINVTRFKDSTLFFKAMEAFRKEFNGQPGWQPHYDRLLGYYYYDISPRKTITHYRRFIEARHEDKHFNYRDLAEAFWSLRVAHRRLRQYERAAFYAKQSFVLYGCAENNLPIDRKAAIQMLDSTKRYCLITSGFFAEDLLEKFSFTDNLSDLELANDYFEYLERHRWQNLLRADEDAFLAFQFEEGNQFSEEGLKAAFTAWTISKNPKWLDRGLACVESLKSVLLYRDMRKQVTTDALTDSIRMFQGELNHTLFALYKGDIEAEDLLRKDEYVKELRNLESRRNKRKILPKSNISNKGSAIADLSAELSDRQAVVHYYTTPKQLYILYVDQDTSLFLRQRTNVNELRAAVRDYRISIEQEVKLDEEHINRYLYSARRLYEILVSPFRERLVDIDELIVIPDQLLAPIPFEAFLSQDADLQKVSFSDLPYLLLQARIVYVSSWKTYQANRDRRNNNLRNESIGFWTTPSLSTKNGMQVIEHSVAAGFKERYTIFSQRSGGKASFLREHHRFGVLHLLLHAKSSRTNRYDNRIRFGEGEEDVIYGFEFYQQSLNAQLMVLASCESAVGAPRLGEGTFSLARSVINAGIPEIVAAQFLIPQTTTGPLLDRFYRHLAQGKNAAASLHQAKLDYLDSITNDRHAYPRFWAGMIVLN